MSASREATGTPATKIQESDASNSGSSTAPSETTGTPLLNITLILLTIVYAFNFIDRQILVIMQEAIKAELGLSDTQLGMLTGPAFALFYTTIGIPVAWLADRSNRRNIIAISLTLWSGMTAVSGLAANFTQLFLARVGVGIGEAGGSPPAHSMISDMYEEKRRATALAIYSSGLYLGILIGYVLGGYISAIYGWRNTLFIVGLPGVALALLMILLVKEPPRRFTAKQAAQKASFKETLATVIKLKSFKFFAFGCAMSAFVSYGAGNFLPSYLVRYHGFERGELGLTLGLITGIGGIIGTFLGGRLTDHFGKKDPRMYMWLPGLTAVLGIPFGLYSYNGDNIVAILACLFIATVLGTMYLAPSIATAHRLVSPRMRAMTSAILFLILNLIGLGLGPLFVGMLSDLLTNIRGTESLHMAVSIMVTIALAKGWLFWRGGHALVEDLAEQESNQQSKSA